jgi:hypothetical protein
MMTGSPRARACRLGGGWLSWLPLVVIIPTFVLGTGVAPAQEEDENQPSVVREDQASVGFVGGPRNMVNARNQVDGRLLVRGRIQLNRINGSTVQPVNYASAYSSCVDCTTLSVALQIDVYQQDADTVMPQNAGVAFNEQCTRCRTVALALQYAIPADDPKTAVDDDAEELAKQMESEMRAIQADSGKMSLDDAESRIVAVAASFQSLAATLSEERDERVSDDAGDNVGPASTPTPTPEATATLAPTATAVPLPTAEPTVAPISGGTTPTTTAAGSLTPTAIETVVTPSPPPSGTPTPIV